MQKNMKTNSFINFEEKEAGSISFLYLSVFLISILMLIISLAIFMDLRKTSTSLAKFILEVQQLFLVFVITSNYFAVVAQIGEYLSEKFLRNFSLILAAYNCLNSLKFLNFYFR
ncbi:MAG: hypothetical protein MHMPM18_004939 [Marteilia pararefringens]